MANISVVGRIVSDDIELKISANNRPYLIDRGAYDTYGITKEDVFQGYTGNGGLHGLSRKDYENYHSYSEAKKSWKTASSLRRPPCVNS